MQHRKRKGWQAGFSLIEVLAVLTIMALVLGAVTLGTAGGQNRMRFDALARHVSGEISRTRVTAIRSNREAVFSVDLEARRYGGPGAAHAFPRGVTARLVTARSESAADAAAGQIRFFPDGTSTGGRVELEQAGRLRFIRVDWLTGSVRIEDGETDD